MYFLGACPHRRWCDLADGSDKGGPYDGLPYALSCAPSDQELRLMADAGPPRLAAYDPVTRNVTGRLWVKFMSGQQAWQRERRHDDE